MLRGELEWEWGRVCLYIQFCAGLPYLVDILGVAGPLLLLAC